nr:aromatic ring-hydroxylating dioxygenase subunit alpha [Sphingomonas sp. Y57]
MNFSEINSGNVDEMLGTGPVPIASYVSEEDYRREIDTVFKRCWLIAGTEQELKKPGDWKVKRLDFANSSVVLIRDREGAVRAFHNMCSHRGNKLVSDNGYETTGGNKAGILSCRFHGWVFDAKGALVHVPLEDQFPECFSKDENGLTPIHCAVWQGFIFINLSEAEPEPLESYLGSFAGHFDGFPFSALTQSFAYHTILDTNWKVGMDAFAEAYHVATLHAGALGNLVKCGIDGVKFHGIHKSSSVYFDMKPAHTPVAEIANRYATSNLASRYHQGRLELPETINPAKLDNFAFELAICFPNMLIHVAQDTWFTHQFWPISSGRTLWEGRFYMPGIRTNSGLFAAEYTHLLARSAWLEDTGTMEDTYQAMLSGAKDRQWLMKEEVLIRHQLAVIEALAGTGGHRPVA